MECGCSIATGKRRRLYRHARSARGLGVHGWRHQLRPIQGVPEPLRLRFYYLGQGPRPDRRRHLARLRRGDAIFNNIDECSCCCLLYETTRVTAADVGYIVSKSSPFFVCWIIWEPPSSVTSKKFRCSVRCRFNAALVVFAHNFRLDQCSLPRAG